MSAEADESNRYVGLGLGLGVALGATVCWVLPIMLQAESGWQIAGQVAAWAFYTVAAGASLIEIENATGRLGFNDLGVAAMIISIGAGLLALGTRVLPAPFSAISSVLGAVVIVIGLACAGMGVGRLASGNPRKLASQPHPETGRRQSRVTIPEVIAISLAAVQVILGALALLRP